MTHARIVDFTTTACGPESTRTLPRPLQQYSSSLGRHKPNFTEKTLSIDQFTLLSHKMSYQTQSTYRGDEDSRSQSQQNRKNQSEKKRNSPKVISLTWPYFFRQEFSHPPARIADIRHQPISANSQKRKEWRIGNSNRVSQEMFT